MKLSIVFPMFWGRKKKEIYKEGDHFYDHPTALDDEGTIPALFNSMSVLKDREWDIIAIAGGNHPSIADEVERTAQSLLSKYAETAGVHLHYFSYSHQQRLHEWLRDIGKADLTETIELLGYSPMRNACLVAAHILGKDITVSIDDDCVFIDPSYITHIKENILSDFEERPILAYTGPYITKKNTIRLEPPSHPHDVFLNGIEAMNEAFKKYIIDTPGKKDCPFAIMGNIAVHKDFFSRIPLDPPMRRGEDMDWVMNSHLCGERFIMDSDLPIKHCPPPRPYPSWRPLREDIYRFFYQRRKIMKSHDGNGYYKLDLQRYIPYPGTFFQDDYFDRVTQGCTLMAIQQIMDGDMENARETLNNIHHAKLARDIDDDPFSAYIAFQKKWEEMMGIIADKRDKVRKIVFGS